MFARCFAPFCRLLACWLLACALLSPGLTEEADLNPVVLQVLDGMPSGGEYAATAVANQRLAEAIRLGPTGLLLSPETARPSYCSGATFQVFAATVDRLVKTGVAWGSPQLFESLLIKGQRDGEGVWGRWNANGPGTARLFAEAGLGRNFTDWKLARPGDFLKVWWNDEIGHKERGHSVIFLDNTKTADGDAVVFWSSNQPGGYGRKTVARSKIRWALFSRLENPDGLRKLATLPKKDDYLAAMLNRASTHEEVAKLCGMPANP